MVAIRNIVSMQAVRSAGRLAAVRVAPLSTSASLRLKESSLNTDPEFDKHKMDSLEKQKKGDGHWKPELASDSEENVKADRGPSGPEHIQELQAQAKKDAEAAKRGGS